MRTQIRFRSVWVTDICVRRFTYVWDYKKNWPNVKWSKPIDDVLVLDPVAEMFVLGCTVDYVRELGGSYLKVINPNATASCGCGESFAV